MLKKLVTLSLVLVMIICPLAACGGATNKDSGKSTTASKDNIEEMIGKPVELTFFLASITAEEFNNDVVPIVKKKYPNWTLKGITGGKGTSLSELIASDQIPDFIVGSKGAIPAHAPYGTYGDISDLIKKYNYDMSRFNPAYIDIMTSNFGGKIIGFPYKATVYALQYNKDLFDRFGVPYPTDGMTWDQIYELDKRLTRTQDGTLYRGYSERWQNILLENNQFSLPWLDTKEEKSALLTDTFQNYAKFILQWYQLPGLKFDMKTSNPEEDRLLFQKGLSAMQIFQMTDKLDFKWDLVSVPTFKEKPGVNLQANAIYWLMSKQSKHRDEGFVVMSYLASDEVQKQLAANGKAPVIKNSEAQKAFMSNNPLYSGKNIGAYFYLKAYAAEPPERDAKLLQGYSNAASQLIKDELQQVMSGTKDLNTALRDADERIRKGIDQRKAEQK